MAKKSKGEWQRRVRENSKQERRERGEESMINTCKGEKRRKTSRNKGRRKVTYLHQWSSHSLYSGIMLNGAGPTL